MNIKKVTALYISPTGGTRGIALRIAQHVAQTLGVPLCESDITLPVLGGSTHFTEDDLVICASPVYAGRLPNKLLCRFDALSGGGAATAAVVVYGGRSFGDALSELDGVLAEHGFRVFAAAAFVARHAFSDEISVGRPDEKDGLAMQRFAEALCEKAVHGDFSRIRVPGAFPPGAYYTPLGVDGTPAVFLKAKPVTDASLCRRCGACAAVCPVGSIKKDAPELTEGVCIKCQACIRTCPQGARSFDNAAFLSHVAMLKSSLKGRPKPELFI